LFQISLSLLCTSPQFVNWRFANVKNNSRIFTARRVCIARTMSWQDVCPSVCPSVTRRYCVNQYLASLQGHDDSTPNKKIKMVQHMNSYTVADQ